MLENGARFFSEEEKFNGSSHFLQYLREFKFCVGSRLKNHQQEAKEVICSSETNKYGSQLELVFTIKSRNPGGVNSDSLALGVRHWTHCAQDMQSWKDIIGQALTKYWF
jgi:hypothetical protein